MVNKKEILEQVRVKKMESLSSDFLTDMAKEIHRSELKKIVPIYRKPLFFMLTSAAACAVVVLTIVLTPHKAENVSLAQEFAEISSAEILAYVDENLEEFEEDLLGEFVADFELDEVSGSEREEAISKNSQVAIPTLEDLQNDEILDYLQEEGYDIYDEDLNDFI